MHVYEDVTWVDWGTHVYTQAYSIFHTKLLPQRSLHTSTHFHPLTSPLTLPLRSTPRPAVATSEGADGERAPVPPAATRRQRRKLRAQAPKW